MTDQAKQTASVKISAGLLWSAAQNRGQVVLLSKGPEGLRCLVRETVTDPGRWAGRLPSASGGGKEESAPVSLVVGLNSSQVGFYVFEVPSVQEPQLTAIVHTQAESCLPLSVNAMRMAWRVDPDQPADRCVLAAVRNEVYQQTLSQLPDTQTLSMAPDAVGLIACWHECYQSSRQKTVVLYFTEEEAMAVLTESGRILNAVRVDMDPQQTRRLLIGDLLQALHSLSPDIRQTDLFLMETGSDPHAGLLEELEKEGFHVHRSALDRDKLGRLGRPDPKAIEICPEAFGLALLGLAARPVDFDFTRRQAEPEPTVRGQLLSVPVLRTVLSIAAAVIITAIGLYWKDKVQLNTLQRQLTQAEQGQTAQRLLQEIGYRRQVAQVRPDMLELLDILRQVLPEEIILDQFLFERGRPVELRAVASGFEQAYEFQKKLQSRSEIRQVQLVEPTLDERTRKVNFTIRFMYRNFSG